MKKQVLPLANQKQYDRVQGYIKYAEEREAELLIGGEGILTD